MPSKACETLLYAGVSHILRHVRLPAGGYHTILLWAFFRGERQQLFVNNM